MFVQFHVGQNRVFLAITVSRMSNAAENDLIALKSRTKNRPNDRVNCAQPRQDNRGRLTPSQCEKHMFVLKWQVRRNPTMGRRIPLDN